MNCKLWSRHLLNWSGSTKSSHKLEKKEKKCWFSLKLALCLIYWNNFSNSEGFLFWDLMDKLLRLSDKSWLINSTHRLNNLHFYSQLELEDLVSIFHQPLLSLFTRATSILITTSKHSVEPIVSARPALWLYLDCFAKIQLKREYSAWPRENCSCKIYWIRLHLVPPLLPSRNKWIYKAVRNRQSRQWLTN